MKKTLLLLLGLVTLFFASCSDDDDVPDEVNEQEVITKVVFTLVNTTDASDVVTFTAEADALASHDHDEEGDDHDDEDGDDHDDDDHDDDEEDEVKYTQTGELSNNATYTGKIGIFNKEENVIVEEINNELEDHQVFYEIEDTSGIVIEYADEDANGNPVGLSVTVTTTTIADDASIGVVLRHLPNKKAEGVKEGNIENAGGEDDFDVDFEDLKVKA